MCCYCMINGENHEGCWKKTQVFSYESLAFPCLSINEVCVCVCLNWPRVHFGVPPGGSRCWGEVSVLCLYFHHMYMHQAHSFMTSKYLLTEWITECHRWPHAGFRELQSMLVMLLALIRNLFGWLWFLSFGVFGLSAKWKL